MSFKALLIYPAFPENGFWNYGSVCKLMGAKYPAAPLGMITVAALLPQEWEMKLIDMNAEKITSKDFEWADLVLTGGMLPQQNSILEIIEKSHSFNKKILVGGPDPSSQPHIYHDADYLFLGETENTMNLFLKDFELGVPKGIYKSSEKPCMSESPIPRFDLLNFDNYIMVGIQFCRGCPYNCEFCEVIELFGKVPRLKTPEQVIKELDTLYQLGYRGHVDFVDDNFIGNKSKAKEILLLLKDWSISHNYPFYFSTEASINLADEPELLALMRDLDFRYVFVGIESPDPEILKAANKLQNVNRKITESLDKIYEHGMVVNAGLIIGFDKETSETARLIIETIENGKIAMPMIGLLYALPNTQLAKRLLSENRMKDDSTLMKDSQAVDQTTTGLNFITLRPKVEIQNDFMFILNSVYDTKNYFNRILRLSKRLRPAPKQKRTFKQIFKSAKAFFKLIFIIALNPKRAYYFWRNTLILLFSKPSVVETAVNLMAMHLHFKKQVLFITQGMQKKNTALQNAESQNFEKKLISQSE